MNEENIKTGAIADTPDERDYKYHELGFGSAPFDWTLGYDVEKDLGKTLDVKDQNGSFSCGGQAWSYLGQVLDPDHEQKSAKFIYANTHVGSGGSAGRTNSDFVIKKGWGSEALTASYNQGNPPTEDFMIRPYDITPEAYTHALTDKALSYAVCDINIDSIAQAIRDNKGVILGIVGQNNGTWVSKFPTPPQGTNGLWYHWIYAGKALLFGGKKYIGFCNSWGKSVGENGWQYISAEYLTPEHIFNTWTMVYKNTDTIINVIHNFTQTLKFGMRGDEVKALQAKLAQLGYFQFTPTGYFGVITLGAVKKFQTDRGLIADGIVGKLTNHYLNQ